MSKAQPSTVTKALPSSVPPLNDGTRVWDKYRNPPETSGTGHAANNSKASSVWIRYTDARMKQFGAR